MHRAIYSLLLLLAACSRDTGGHVCTGDHWWNCKYFKNAEDAAAYAKESAEDERRELLSSAKSLDIDYQKCAVVVLSAEMGKPDPTNGVRQFVTIFGEDPSPYVISGLAEKGLEIEPGSLQSRSTNVVDGIAITSSKEWSYHFLLRRRMLGGYTARVASSCGALCGAVQEYQLKKSADSCDILSVKLLRAY